MTTADRWTRAVRQQLGLGRLLPLGGPGDGAWIAETAARAVLRRAANEVPGVRLGSVRITLADPEDVHDPAVPAPPSALPPGPLRVAADFAATAAEPLPTTASRLRTAVSTAAEQGIGLTVTEVDLRVTDLLDVTAGDAGTGEGAREAEDAGEATADTETSDAARASEEPDEAMAATAALGVAGVARLTGALGGVGRAVHIEQGGGSGAALPRRHVRVELAVRADHRALDVARAVRARVGEALRDHPTVAVLVTAVT
ncbi:nucleopolyhedrovirus P10 family protein [Streptomyces sp. AS58]|uniref:Nucleopolyhedrovirus P10 family protein n=1 Tax=Streptomyces cadmiisoli TaxID=2184053 RepID=A0A2Z4J4X4_9ACTN|nr:MULTISPECIES: hypothetical protein [Streptomyces]AWW40272.1 nucleopolyhedrovirus P10 family protein [Streptomyces cadmiisoli]KOV65136.1 nucleopolyhedrovirus P10 family protein [Streptomyces sp. AS58]